MGKKIFIKNFSYVMLSNLFSLVISSIIVLIIPHFAGEKVYSYYQLENLYCSYLWVFSIGWLQGLYIKYGGISREKLMDDNIAWQLVLLVTYSVLLLSLMLLITNAIVFQTEEKKTVFILSVISISIELLMNGLKYLLQAVNDMKSFSISIILDRGIYICIVIACLFASHINYVILISIDLLSKLIALIYLLIQTRDFYKFKQVNLKDAFQKTEEAIKIGISVELASYLRTLINSIVQVSIEWTFGVITFGKVSLTLSISNMFTKFVAAISTVLFPVLRNTSTEKQEKLYSIMATILRTVLLGAFIGYLPLKLLLGIWLPNYKESLHFLAILLPVSLYETKVTMLNNTYLKTIRQEKKILLSNVMTVLVSILVSFVSVYILKSLELAMLGIVFMLAFRSMLEEHFLEKYMRIQTGMFPEIIMTIIFIVFSWGIDGWIGMLGYAICYIGYLWIQKKEILQAVMYLKNEGEIRT